VYNEGFTRPVVAIDNNGNGLLAFTYRQTDPCTTGGGTRQIRYSVWNGTNLTFGPDALLAASAAPPNFDVDSMAVAFSSLLVVGANDSESLDGRSGMRAAADQRGHVGVAFPVTAVTDPWTGAGLSHDVWRAIWNATTNSWQNGTAVDAGGNPAIAYGAEVGGDRGRMVYQGPEPPPGGGVDPTINRSLLNGTDIAPVGQVDAATGYAPTIAQLAPDTALVVWADGNGFLRFWQRIGGVPPSESTGDVNAPGGAPFLAARTGSPQ